MTRYLLLLTFIAILLIPYQSKAQEDSYTQLEVGYPIGISVKYGYILGIERKPASFKRFTLAVNYGFHRIQDVTISTPKTSSSLAQRFQYITALARFFPMANKLSTKSGPYISMGYQYYWRHYNETLIENFHGVRIEAGGQVSINKLLVVSGNIDFYVFYSTSMLHINNVNFGGLNLNLKVGIRIN